METGFLNHVLGWSLMALLAVPSTLEAWPATTDNSDVSTALVTGYYSTGTDGHSTATEKVFHPVTAEVGVRLLATGTNAVHRHTDETQTSTDGNLASEQTEALTEGGSRSTDWTSGLSAEPPVTPHVDATTEASNARWEDLPITDHLLDVSPPHSLEPKTWAVTEESRRLLQDSPGAGLRLGDAAAPDPVTFLGISVQTDGTYVSTTNSRAGERTLLSVTSYSSSSSSSSNSTSSLFTEDSDSEPPPSTWTLPVTSREAKGYTGNDNRDTANVAFSGGFSERDTERPGVSEGTDTQTGGPNATHHQTATASEEAPNSTQPLEVTEKDSTDAGAGTGAGTDQPVAPVSSTPPAVSFEGGATNSSGTTTSSSHAPTADASVEPSTRGHTSSSGSQGESQSVSPQTEEETTYMGLTTAPPTVGTSATTLDDSLARGPLDQPPFIQTDGPSLATEVLTTTLAATHRSQVTKAAETSVATDSSQVTAATTPSLSPAASSTSSGVAGPTDGPPAPHPTTSSSAASTPGQRTSVGSTPLPPSQTQEATVPEVGPTHPTTTTLRLETTTATPGNATTTGGGVTTAYSRTTPARATVAAHTTGQQTDRGTTEVLVTTAPALVQPTKAPPVNPCASNPCINGGMCVSYGGRDFTCHCLQAWTGPTCSQDKDECERDPCPPGSRCVNTRGSFSCECPLGFDLEDGRTCTKAKTFLGTFSVNRPPHDPVLLTNAVMHEIQREIIQLLNASLSVLHGYSRSTLSKKQEDGVLISAVNMFSVATDVTSGEVYNSIQMFLSNCSASTAHCRVVVHYKLTYHEESLCLAQKTQCDTERSACTDNNGTAYCQCLPGYYKHNPEDLSCIECGDGYKLENGTCVQCMFGFGGFNCGNFYKLIAVVVSPAVGGLLLILIIALIVTCCKKDKNDINKIIFKSGDLQMSPYADFPKPNRVSTEWGRETIEMQENGSTKNLLQMTDIYYSPALRNADLERNGLYPFTGLPGSRHSCIYPAQWNPSFISDDSRRRDYF